MTDQWRKKKKKVCLVKSKRVQKGQGTLQVELSVHKFPVLIEAGIQRSLAGGYGRGRAVGAGAAIQRGGYRVFLAGKQLHIKSRLNRAGGDRKHIRWEGTLSNQTC